MKTTTATATKTGTGVKIAIGVVVVSTGFILAGIGIKLFRANDASTNPTVSPSPVVEKIEPAAK